MSEGDKNRLKMFISTTVTIMMSTGRDVTYCFLMILCLKVTVNCGIVHVYTSYKTPHPGPAFYDLKETATDDRPLALFLNKSVDGRPLYITYVGKKLPGDVSGLKHCNDSGYSVTFTDKKKTRMFFFMNSN